MKTSITVVPVGPGDPSLLTMQTVDVLLSGGTLVLRTGKHPVAEWLRGRGREFMTLDSLYETAGDFDSLNLSIAEYLWKLSVGSPVIYAVPDPLSDRSVDELYRMYPERASEITVLPGTGLSSALLCSVRDKWNGSDVRVASASALMDTAFDPELPLLVTEIDSAVSAGDVKIYLSGLRDDEAEVYFFTSPGQSPLSVPLYELDRQPAYDHLSAVFVPGAGCFSRSRHTLHDLERIMDRLRAPDGCPWDSVQTHSSLKPYIVEEAWEAVNAIDEDDMDHLADELGDVLFQVMFHSAIGRAFDEFTLTDVISGICEKMIKRHPHVFSDTHFDTAGDVADSWETMKRSETGSRSVGDSLDDVSPGLPSLKYAIKLNKKLRQLPALRRPPEEKVSRIQELSRTLVSAESGLDEQNMGKLLFACAELCHCFGVDGEIILHEAADRVKKLYKNAEKLVISGGKSPESLTFSELCVYLKHVEGEIE